MYSSGLAVCWCHARVEVGQLGNPEVNKTYSKIQQNSCHKNLNIIRTIFSKDRGPVAGVHIKLSSTIVIYRCSDLIVAAACSWGMAQGGSHCASKSACITFVDYSSSVILFWKFHFNFKIWKKTCGFCSLKSCGNNYYNSSLMFMLYVIVTCTHEAMWQLC